MKSDNVVGMTRASEWIVVSGQATITLGVLQEIHTKEVLQAVGSLATGVEVAEAVAAVHQVPWLSMQTRWHSSSLRIGLPYLEHSVWPSSSSSKLKAMSRACWDVLGYVSNPSNDQTTASAALR